MAYLRLEQAQAVVNVSDYGTSSYELFFGGETYETIEEAEKAVREKGGWVVETLDVKLVKSTAQPKQAIKEK